MVKIIGVDLGTSNSSVAVMDRGQARVIEDARGNRIIPTVVGIDAKGEIIVGASARQQLETNPEFTFTGLKRLLGRRADDPNVQEWANLVAYEIVAGPGGEAMVRGPDRLYTPVELLGHVCAHLKHSAEAALGEEVTKAVIGVPAHFDMPQKEALRTAARLGGLEPVRLLPEPTGAAVAYGVDRSKNRTMAVYDFGGGTFDVTILKITGQKFRALATSGDPFLGGEDFDQRIVEWLVERFKEKHSKDLRDDHGAKNRVRIAAERAKHELSSVQSHTIFEKYISEAPGRAVLYDLNETLEREVFDELVADLVDRTRAPCREALRRAKVDVRDIDEVVLVGGMTRMPRVQEVVAEIFERTPGRRIDPMFAVALGCAMQGAALVGEIKSIDLRETVARSILIEVGNGSGVPLIRAGKPIPARESIDFGMAESGADAAAVRIYEGDLKIAGDNRQIGVMVLNNQAQHRAPLIRITGDLSEDGILTVTALDVHSKEKIEHRFHAESGMSEAERDGLRDLDADYEEEAA